LLNWAARYFPILRVLKNHAEGDRPVLEVGSGSFGLAYFWRGRVVGCDITFPSPPCKNMLPVRGTATQLPFGDSSFETLVASDMLEHIPPEGRLPAIQEALRVTRKVAVFGFPCGAHAHTLDEAFLAFHRLHNLLPPDWLEEHMRYPFPGEDLFNGFQQEWSVESFGNENLRFHDWVNQKELSGLWNRVFRIGLRFAPRLVETWLKTFDREPFYRRIFVLVRHPNQGVRSS